MFVNTQPTGIKGELGKLEFYFRKIPLHQQKFLVVSVLTNSSWLSRNLNLMDQNEVTKLFQLATLFAKQRCLLNFFVSLLL